MAGYGLDDSDVEEFLEGSEDDDILIDPPTALAATAYSHQQHILLTATAWRGPSEGASEDTCKLIPPSRCGN